jgi:hypothetical protein
MHHKSVISYLFSILLKMFQSVYILNFIHIILKKKKSLYTWSMCQETLFHSKKKKSDRKIMLSTG